MRPQTSLTSLFAVAMLALGTLSTAQVADEKKADVTGTWTGEYGEVGYYRVPKRITLKLKADGEKLTGTVTERHHETEISDGKIKGNEISFTVKYTVNQKPFVEKHTGKVNGDNIIGNSEHSCPDCLGKNPAKENWIAKRVVAEKK